MPPAVAGSAVFVPGALPRAGRFALWDSEVFGTGVAAGDTLELFTGTAGSGRG